MDLYRRYGPAPYRIIVIHGGPGAPGYMKPVAEELSTESGVVEPLLSEDSIEGQLAELKKTVDDICDTPVHMIGHSWGAWLGLIYTVEFADDVKKLILLNSGPFEQRYKEEIRKNRTDRLDHEERKEFIQLSKIIDEGDYDENVIERYIELVEKADSFDPVSFKNELIEFQPDVNKKVWREAERMRKSGKLMSYAEKIDCPVVAIHGEYDPHPFEGVEIPLSDVVNDFKFILIEDCGHYPWREKKANREFYRKLRDEL
ncbi:MAG: alpha/beta hydrolase [Thermoplasmata archaeon]